MNSKTARKLHQMVRRVANRDMELYQSMRLRDRLKVAYRIIFKR